MEDLKKDYLLKFINNLAEQSERDKDSIYFKHINCEADPGYILVEWDGKPFIIRIEEA